MVSEHLKSSVHLLPRICSTVKSWSLSDPQDLVCFNQYDEILRAFLFFVEKISSLDLRVTAGEATTGDGEAGSASDGEAEMR
ncbi:hypothetical protein Ccrd_018406 [Cynara cardunculus var. scolymus]|uniref:Uncharacterized protein n=1 Tax=Cynara cardunculus var. scolymus TaxID=59895 RepID=A0A103Y699_CYNCS|nr:hypothetical protein Ccrd_018406 [Cynara cardunculus var. scolymus]